MIVKLHKYVFVYLLRGSQQPPVHTARKIGAISFSENSIIIITVNDVINVNYVISANAKYNMCIRSCTNNVITEE